jgi:phosphatidylglycerophosphatase C
MKGSITEEQEAIRQSGLAAFDFDGTLAGTHSCTRFLLKYSGPIRYTVALFRAALEHGFKPSKRDEIKIALLKYLLRGQEAEDFKAAGERFSYWVERLLDRRSMAKLRWHQECGHYVILVSASLGACLRPLGTRLGVDQVYAVELSESKGILTGSVEGGSNMTRRAKELAVRRFLDCQSIGRDDITIWAYGDSSGDADMLRFSDIPTLVRLKGKEWGKRLTSIKR